ncbi:hypothetical protein HRI_004441600 [Hibiscus trionum]|uniref:Histone acetyltransferase n=1 Tax=Hibiscus trionum TaxID=183268 RepID=A0A9W7J9J7_HIBTR|nr:hypothetical protein HRI_004441600 [Hibiscus trionum]
MPRRGPKPYVCKRRAWHSDRHQPMRGSLVQEIFRVVNEIHSSATKKNKEWQEKLPVVVLKAEEIMYSKANSEAEYMDLKGLWDRTNDAINTIIRLDESTETGVLLQPCIEAALNLGCTPRRTSRSQRDCNLWCYLNPGTQEADSIARGNVTANSHCMVGYSSLMRPTTMNATHFNSAHSKCPFASENGSLPSSNPCLPIEKYPRNLCSVFPLLYGNHHRFEEPWHDFGVSPKLISNTVAPAKMDYIHNLLFSDVDSLNKMNQTDVVNASKNPHELDCDLSLRLGPLSTPCSSVRNDQPREIGKNNSTSPERNKFNDKSSSSFLRSNGDDPLNSSSNERGIEGEHGNVDATTRKRKTVYGLAADQQFRLPSKLPCIHLTWPW